MFIASPSPPVLRVFINISVVIIVTAAAVFVDVVSSFPVNKPQPLTTTTIQRSNNNFPQQHQRRRILDGTFFQRHYFLSASSDSSNNPDEQLPPEEQPDDDDDDDDANNNNNNSNMERAWRYVKKPLISIGGKGATLTHGNSLRQLLDAHQIVKVKVNNTRKFHNNSLQEAYNVIKSYAIEAGASSEIELLQLRQYDKIILFGLPGMRQQILRGDFPPPPNIDPEEKEEEETSG